MRYKFRHVPFQFSGNFVFGITWRVGVGTSKVSRVPGRCEVVARLGKRRRSAARPQLGRAGPSIARAPVHRRLSEIQHVFSSHSIHLTAVVGFEQCNFKMSNAQFSFSVHIKFLSDWWSRKIVYDILRLKTLDLNHSLWLCDVILITNS